jgi:cytochrome d ubiquinol oxidase subunit I
MGISAYHLMKKNQTGFFRRSFTIAAVFGLFSTIAVAAIGDFHAAEVARTQPTKFAAMEALWDTQKNVGYNLFIIPDTANECNAIEGPCVPSLLSYMAFHNADAEIKGLKAFPKEERPPVLPTFWSFRIMLFLGFAMLLMTIMAVIYAKRGTLELHPMFLTIMMFSIPLPYIAGELGWVVAEVGRQPWIVYGVLKTTHAVSLSISTIQVYASLLGFTLLYGGLGVVDIYLLSKFAKKGPDNDVTTLLKPAKEEA